MGFAGCHEISWHCLRVIAELCEEAGDELSVVFNLLPESGAKHAAFVEFDSLETEYHFSHQKVKNLGSPETLELLRALSLDAFFIIGWHRIVTQDVIDCAPYCIGMHSSLLPKDRGSSPINWAIIRGEKQGGMSMFHLSTGVDSGDLIAQKAFSIDQTNTCSDVYDKATVAAAQLLRENWRGIKTGNLPRIRQDESLATVNERRRPEDGMIDWSKGAKQLYDWVRGLTHPYPGGFSILRGRKVFIWNALYEEQTHDVEPGIIVSVGEYIRVATGSGFLDAISLQFEGEPECRATVFTSTYGLQPGEKMVTTPPITS